MSELSETFKVEVDELLEELESALIELEDHPENRDLVERVFRALHTIKGNSTVVGFAELVAFAHEVETAFDLVRKGQLAYSPELGNLAMSARDQIRHLIEAECNGEPGDGDESLRILSALEELAASQSGDRKAEAKARATDGLTVVEAAVRVLRDKPADMATRRQSFDALVKVRDAVAVIGADLVEFIRNYLGAFQAMQQDNVNIPSGLLDAVAEAVAYFPKMIADADDPNALANMDPMALFASMEKPMALVARLKDVCSAAGLKIDGPAPTTAPARVPGTSAATAGADAADAHVPPATWRIRFVANPSFAESGIILGDLFRELRALGTTSLVTEPPAQITAGSVWEVLLSTTRDANAIRDVFVFAENGGTLTLTLVDAGEGTDPNLPERRVGEILIDRGDLTADELHLALRHQDNKKATDGKRSAANPGSGE